MKEARILAVLTGIALLIATVGCSATTPAEIIPTANIDATVEARAKALVAAQPTPTPVVVVKEVTPTPNIDAMVEARAKELIAAQPTPAPGVVVKEVTHTPATEPTIAPAPTGTSAPTNAPVPTNIPAPTHTPVPSEVIVPTAKPTRIPTATPSPNIGIPKYMDGVWLCTDTSAPLVDDLSTQQSENYRCSVTVEYTDEFAIVKSNGIPNHDYESGPGCCAGELEYEWRIPLKPELASSVTYAPVVGPVAISVNGVPFYGPEEGPGGDAVALHFEYFVEDRQPIIIGICGAHSAGTEFHYHFDGNCVHWHPEEEKKEWKDWDVDLLVKDEASPVIGFSFDGYPIYGPYGNDSNNTLKEMTSSYRLKAGKNGYDGIDDWEYVQGLGDLDECNGITSEVTGLNEPLYHYHASKTSGSGEIGFPYFILCYSGIPETSNIGQGDQGPAQGSQAPGSGTGTGNGAPGGKPECLPPNPPPGKDNYPPDWSDLIPCS